MTFHDIIRSRLSSRQQEALNLQTKSVMTAGAGAGKTRTLVALVCRDLLVENKRPENILICTFTRAAAANLVQKITQELAEIHPTHQVDISRMWIGTIDSLCVRFLKENAITAGLAPSFTVASQRHLAESEQSALSLALLQSDISDVRIIDQVIDTSSSAFATEILGAYERMRMLGFDPGSLVVPTPYTSMYTRNEVIKAIGDLQAEKITATCEKKLVEDLQGITNDDPFAMSNAKYGKFAAAIAEQGQEVKEMIQDYRLAMTDQKSHEIRMALARVMSLFDLHFKQAKRSRESLDFLDLAFETNKLLDAHPHLARFERIYIDEAQDTNALQLSVLQNLQKDTGAMMAVGDASQSIYAFRGADIEGFKTQKILATESVTLDENYRSHPEIIDFVNAACARIEGLQDDAVQMTHPYPGEQETSIPRVNILVATDETNIDATTEAEMSIQAIMRLKEELNYENRDICILCRSNDDCIAYADALTRESIAVALVQNKGLYARTECQDVMAYLRLLTDPTDDEAMLRVLSSPFVGLSDPDLFALATSVKGYATSSQAPLATIVSQNYPAFWQKYEKMSTMSKQMRPHQTLLMSCAMHNYDLALEILDATGSAWRNIEKLASILQDIETTEEGTHLGIVLTRLEDDIALGIDTGQDTHIDPTLDAVRVMTIHNAKGDEFPLTVLAKLSKRSNVRSPLINITQDGEMGLALPGTEKLLDSYAARERERVIQLEADEQKRLLYVAMTRAKESLCMIMSAKVGARGNPLWAGNAQILAEEVLPANWGSPDPSEIEEVDEISTWPIQIDDTASARVWHLQKDADVIHERKEITGQLPFSDDKPSIGETIYSSLPLVSQTRSFSSLITPKEPLVVPAFFADILSNKLQEPELVFDWNEKIVATDFGTRVHRVLARVDWATGVGLEQVAQIAENQEEAKRLKKITEMLLDNPLTERLKNAEIIGVEQEFYVRVGSELLHGYIDLIARDNEGVFIVDWKTGLEEHFQYELQGKIYALAVFQDRVETHFVHLEKDHTETQIYTDTSSLQTDILDAIDLL